MTTQELLRLLKPIFEEVCKSEGKLSALEAVEVIEKFKTEIQDEAIEKFIETYGFLYERKTVKQARTFYPRRVRNPKNSLVKCR